MRANEETIKKQKKLNKIDMVKDYAKFLDECYDEDYYTKCYTIVYNYEKVKPIKMEFVNVMLSLTKNVKRILVVGCATGTFVKVLEEEGFFVVGLDISDWALKHAVAKGDGMIRSDVRFMPFKNNSFDIILAPSMIEQMPKEFVEAMIKEFARVSEHYVIALTAYGDRYTTLDHIIKESKEWWWNKFEPTFTIINKKNPHHYPKTLPNERWDIILAEKIQE